MKIEQWSDGTWHNECGEVGERFARALLADQASFVNADTPDEGQRVCKHTEAFYKGFDTRPTCIVCGKRL